MANGVETAAAPNERSVWRAVGTAIAVLAIVIVGGVVLLVGLVILVLGNLDVELGRSCSESEDSLIAAAAKGDSHVVRAELDAGGEPDREHDDVTALECAAEAGRVGVAEVLLDLGADPSDAALHAAAASGSGRGSILDLGFPSNSNSSTRLQVAELLLEHGADPDGGSTGPSPVLASAWRGRNDFVELLLDHGADPDHGGEVDSGLVTMAQTFGPEGPSGGSPPYIPADVLPEPVGDSVENVPPLVGAAWSGEQDMAVSLVAAGADPDLAADEAFTPILAAAVRGDREMVEILLYSGADRVPDVRVGVLAPADAARRARHDDVVDLLDQGS